MKLWIARDKCGNLGLYGSKPMLSSTCTAWNKFYCSFVAIDSKSFLSVTFENSPQEVTITLNND